ncbi:hypothetical protein C9I98_05200 [Photobacterium sanctipauli]|uniref:Outer membrane protein beta-barrel domain-containing protein n=1 Tax=Photobacterium sanctipauli TaxID=1342794 RepID=A0A2T3NZ49_9GAMM|nr:hypothetical protein C9I98_05200 [Photobacterium sanctipauli]
MGYSFSNSFSDENGIDIDIDNDIHYALGLETDLGEGRVGLYLSHQPTKTANFSNDGSLSYVHFQSALRFDTFTHLDTFLGASLGTTIVDADWTDKDLLLSGGLHGGLDYKLTSQLRLVAELRWLVSLIDSDTTTICTLPTGNETCNVRIDSDWMQQFQTNVGVSYSF